MESKPSTGFGPSTSPLLSLSTFIHQHVSRLGTEAKRLGAEAKQFADGFIQQPFSPAAAAVGQSCSFPANSYLPFASVSQQRQEKVAGLSSGYVAKTLAGTCVYNVSNSNNEFVLISDPNSAKSIGLLCFRKEGAEAFLAQVILHFIEFLLVFHSIY
ncbi:protein TIC 22, chloroplastic-like [Lycium ferocissimum]|uniref:protein TIC 22, chloroplastic-like n=1 Tax=Lycium ferocissimum TaxID=112874 RepID=UPI0028149E60|nr:protein TIC 22, chloroplastic-like [Lycium ferocissimum]